MNHLRLTYLFLFILIFSVPYNFAGSGNDTLTYIIKTLKKDNGGCGQEGKNCTEVYLSYPEITGSKKGEIHRLVIERIKAEMNLEIHRNFLTADFGADIEAVARNFFTASDSERVELEITEDSPRNYERVITVLYNKQGLISFGQLEGGYTGGAHPNTYFSTKTFDIYTGKPVSLDNIFNPEKKGEALKHAEKEFRKQLEVPSQGKINDHGFWFPRGVYDFSENFYLTDDAIYLIYNPYEVAAYAVGPIELKLPYEKYKKYFSSWGALSRFVEAEN